MRKFVHSLLVTSCLLLISACASRFPTPANQPVSVETRGEVSGTLIFQRTLKAHGGDNIDSLKNLSVGITGEWKQLIRRIQPLVTDYRYRVDSQERLILKDRVYAANYRGPGGSKSVLRNQETVSVFYNGEESAEAEVLSSTALTADAFFLFLLGPLALNEWRDSFERIADAKLNNQPYHRIYLNREPGFGYAAQDQIVLWVDPSSSLTKMIQITLTGHESTKAAHVEVEYLDYLQEQGFVFPSKFFERVNAPIAFDAHAWELTGLEINRDYSIDQLKGPAFKGEAANEASFP